MVYPGQYVGVDVGTTGGMKTWTLSPVVLTDPSQQAAHFKVVLA